MWEHPAEVLLPAGCQETTHREFFFLSFRIYTRILSFERQTICDLIKFFFSFNGLLADLYKYFLMIVGGSSLIDATAQKVRGYKKPQVLLFLSLESFSKA